MKKLRITVEGKPYEVTVEELSEASQTAAAPTGVASVASASVGAAPASAPAPAHAPSGPGVVTSPLGGVVISVSVEVGQAVKEGEVLLTVEAMKMNTQVFAPNDGSVEEIHVKAGDAVAEGQAMLKLA